LKVLENTASSVSRTFSAPTFAASITTKYNSVHSRLLLRQSPSVTVYRTIEATMSAGECQTKNRNSYDEEKDDKPIKALDEGML
jgi:hypothetical protein